MATSPSDEEMVAIVAAYQAVTKPVLIAGESASAPSQAWRFSGRWWSRPIASRRIRPG
jgi:hypothetical protein